jgi:transposase
MEPEAIVKDLRRRVLQSDLRGLSEAEQGARLRLETGCTARQACQVTKASKGSLYRAEQALKNGRLVGANGRPKHLSEHQEQVLIDLISERCQRGDPPTSMELCDMV